MRISQHQQRNSANLPQTRLSRYAIYCRKSSESDERQIQSLPDQIASLKTFIASKGLIVTDEPFQESKSAKIPGRPVFNQLVQMVEEGTVNGIILLNPSRL